MLRVLLVHNRYQQAGGEDRVFEAEASLLESRGHSVGRYEVHNDAVDEMGRVELAAKTVWNRDSYQALQDLVDRQQPDVVHFHNTLPLISPAGYYAARRGGAAVVQTLHNFRLICPNGLLYRDGTTCTDCVGKAFAWPGIAHACYRDSRATTAAVAGMTALHRGAGTWRNAVDRFVVQTPLARDLFLRGGLPEAKVVVKPNFMEKSVAMGGGGGGAFYIGRLVPEKGVRAVLEAWRDLPDTPLTVMGSGPLAEEVARAAHEIPNVTYLGNRQHADVLAALQRADLLVFPTEWYEGMPGVIIEAFASGVPVLTTPAGAAGSMVSEAGAGPLVPPADPAALAEAVRSAFAQPTRLAAWGAAARHAYETCYTPEVNYGLLLDVYRQALEERHVAPLEAALI